MRNERRERRSHERLGRWFDELEAGPTPNVDTATYGFHVYKEDSYVCCNSILSCLLWWYSKRSPECETD